MTYKLAVILALLTQASTASRNQILEWCDCSVGDVFTIEDDGQVKPPPTPKPDTEVEYLRQTGKGLTPQRPKGKFPFVAVDNGIVQLTIADGDMPVGPCDLGKLVRASRAYMDGIPISWMEPGFMTIKDGDAPGQWEKNGKLLRALQAEIQHCEPKPKEKR